MRWLTSHIATVGVIAACYKANKAITAMVTLGISAPIYINLFKGKLDYLNITFPHQCF